MIRTFQGVAELLTGFLGFLGDGISCPKARGERACLIVGPAQQRIHRGLGRASWTAHVRACEKGLRRTAMATAATLVPDHDSTGAW